MIMTETPPNPIRIAEFNGTLIQINIKNPPSQVVIPQHPIFTVTGINTGISCPVNVGDVSVSSIVGEGVTHRIQINCSSASANYAKPVNMGEGRFANQCYSGTFTTHV